MKEFLRLIPPLEALNKFLDQIPSRSQPEEISTANGLGRVLAESIVAGYPLPSFPRSTVDGYAVRATDTYGASESLPAYLNLIGEVPMGDEPDFPVKAHMCALIHTGGMLPSNADAVVMVEYTQLAREGEIEIMRSVAVGENVLQIGEDVKKGEEVFPAGIRLRPAELGGLMALGNTKISVARCPQVGIISSGDEIVPPEGDMKPGQVRDINTYTLSALVTEFGGIPVSYGIVPDEFNSMKEVASQALIECDVIVITAGSSASTRDLTSQVVDFLGSPGVIVHGVNIRPGKPTILGVAQNKPVIGLPGNPVSALVIAGLFVVPVIELLMGMSVKRPKPRVPARLAVNLASQAGREDWISVHLHELEGEFVAEPIFGKSNLIFSLSKGDGLIKISANATGLSAGEIVDVWLM